MSRSLRWGLLALALTGVHAALWVYALYAREAFEERVFFTVFGAVPLVQLGAGVMAVRAGRADAALARVLAGGVAIATALAGWAAIVFAYEEGGGGRPLRVRGRRVRARVAPGRDWAEDGLRRRSGDAAAWVRQARAEHASVPAFARVAWMLAAAGAPPELLARSLEAGLDEIEHARLCFALAASRGRERRPEPMPELHPDALAALALEGLTDGCMHEGFEAELAELRAARADDPDERAVLTRIASEERAHAELAWDIVRWTLARDPRAAAAAIQRALAAPPACPSPAHADLWHRHVAGVRSRAEALLLSAA